MKKSIKSLIAALTLSSLLLLASPAFAYDGSIHQGKDHASEKSMYLYTFELVVDNPCNSKDMDDDAINELWFDIDYKGNNGYGGKSTYRLDMSYDDDKDRNLNDELVRANFIRNNDNLTSTTMKVWVPGIITEVRVHLNMDGGERLTFTVEGIVLNGFRVNTATDYVTSCYYDSSAAIPCYVPPAAMTDRLSPDGMTRYDQYNGIFSEENMKEAVNRVGTKTDGSMFYHYAE